MNGIAEIELFYQLGDISSVCIHFVAGDGLCGSPMSAAVVSDYPETAIEEEHHLCIPVVR